MKPFAPGLIALFLLVVLPSRLQPQPVAQNPWNGFKPAVAENLAWDRYYIEGFAWPTSVRSGEQVTVYVSVQDTHAANRNYEVRVYRIPDTVHQKNPYTVLQARYIPLHDSLNQLIHYYDSTHTRKPVDYRTGCRTTWAGSTVTIQTSGWQSGLYYARLMSQSHPEKMYNAPFVVRAATPGLTSKILFKFSYNTLQAYNWWGGGSLYSPTQDPNSLTTTNLVAIDRPLESGWSTAFHHPFLGTWHGVFANLMDSLGYQMEYCNNIDLDKTGTGFGEELLSNYKMLVLFQHDEYWSQDERDNIAVFKGERYHGNIASFSANTCYWQVNWDSSSDYSKMYCGKWQGVPSTKWRELVPPNPESKLLGEQYQYGGNALYADSTVEEPPMKARNLQHWIYRGVSFPADSLIGKGWFGITPSGRREEHGIAAQELDNTLTGPAPYPLDTLARRYVWSRGIGTCDSCHCYILHEMTYYEDTVSNARVLAAGGTNWENGLFTFNPVDGTGADRQRMKSITDNIISHFSGKKFIGKIWTYDPENALRWDKNIQLDGNVELLPGRYLKIVGPLRITVDSTFSVNGTLEINGSVTIAGSGHINVGATGEIKLMPGATLTVKCKLITAPNYELNIPVSTTLRIEQQPGELLLGENSLVVVDGALIVNGTAQSRVTITSADAGEIWAGITSGASPPTISLGYANISNAATALTAVGGTNLTVTNCIFSNNTIGINITSPPTESNTPMQIANNTFSNFPINCMGIAIDNYSNVLITDNTLTGPVVKGTGIFCNACSPQLLRNTVQSFKVGMSFTNGSSAMLQDGQFGGYNIVSNNTTAIMCDASDAILGFFETGGEEGGQNTICYNSAADVNINSSTVLAYNLRWQLDTDPPGTFIVTNGDIKYDPWLHDPCGGTSPIVGGKQEEEVNDGGDPMMTPVPALIMQALRERQRGNHLQADALLRAIVVNGSIERKWKQWALGQLLAVGHHLRSRNLSSYFNTVAASEPTLRRRARGLLPASFINEGSFTNAMVAYDANIRDFPNSSEARAGLYGKFSYHLFSQRDTSQAHAMLNQLVASYPQSIEREIAELQMSSFSRLAGSPSSSLMGGVAKAGVATSLQKLPAELRLSQNYPNPFNPATTIKFDMPEASHVSLVIYDVLGRKVAELENGVKEAGYHSATWNATDVSSGIYFARLALRETPGAARINRTLKLIVTK